MSGTGTFWNGEATPARRVSLVVADGPHPLGWYKRHVGEHRAAVEVTIWYTDDKPATVFYIDDADGSGWAKVTEGRGSPRVGHRSLYAVPGTVEDRP